MGGLFGLPFGWVEEMVERGWMAARVWRVNIEEANDATETDGGMVCVFGGGVWVVGGL